MSSFDFSLYDYDDTSAPVKIEATEKVEEFPWDEYDSSMNEEAPQEGFFKSAARTALQIPQGLAEASPLGIISSLIPVQGFGEATNPLEIERLKEISTREGVPFDEEKYLESAQAASGSFPNVGNIARMLEESLGIPLEPKTALQKGLRFGSTIGKLSPGTIAQKKVAGTITGSAKAGWLMLGAPEWAADILSLLSLPVSKSLLKNFEKIPYKQRIDIIEKGIIPENLSKSQFDTAEEILNLLKEKAPPERRGIYPTTELPRGRAAELRQRITRPQDIGMRPSAPITPQTPLRDRIGNTISENRFYNTTQGGRALKGEIEAIDQTAYENVNDMYRQSRELMSDIADTHPDLYQSLDEIIENINEIPSPSTVQNRLRRSARQIQESLVSRENGRVVGMNPITNQQLIDQIQSLRQIIDYDFAHGDANNIFRPLINTLQQTVEDTAINSGRSDAVAAFNRARNGYREWAETFNNPYIRPFRDRTNFDYSKLFKSSLDVDEYNMIRQVLDRSPQGRQLLRGVERDLVDKNLKKFFDNPRSYTGQEFDTALRELEAVITPEQSANIREEFRNASRRVNIRARPVEKAPITNDAKIVAKYLDKKPEDVLKMMNSRTGIRQLRKEAQGSPKLLSSVKKFEQQKMRSLLRGGNIESNVTGNEMYKFLNKEKNFELFSEMIGESETENLRKAAKEIGEAQVKSEYRKAQLSNFSKSYAGYKTFSLLLSLL